MQLSQHAEQAVIAVSTKTAVIAGTTVGSSGVAVKAGVLEFLGTHSAAISSMCMIGGFGIAFLTWLTNIYFQRQRIKRGISDASWEGGIDPDRRGSQNE